MPSRIIRSTELIQNEKPVAEAIHDIQLASPGEKVVRIETLVDALKKRGISDKDIVGIIKSIEGKRLYY